MKAKAKILQVVNRKGQKFKVGDKIKSMGYDYIIKDFKPKSNYMFETTKDAETFYIVAVVHRKKNRSLISANIDFVKKVKNYKA